MDLSPVSLYDRILYGTPPPFTANTGGHVECIKSRHKLTFNEYTCLTFVVLDRRLLSRRYLSLHHDCLRDFRVPLREVLLNISSLISLRFAL